MAIPHCTAPALIVLPAYRRVEATSLLRLLDALSEADLVVARRWPRKDSVLRRIQGRVFNRTLVGVTKAPIDDIGSGVRAIRASVLEELPLYGDFYRFLPILALRDGFRVREVDCPQHEKDLRPPRVYNPVVYLKRLVDLIGLAFLSGLPSVRSDSSGWWDAFSPCWDFWSWESWHFKKLGVRGLQTAPFFSWGCYCLWWGFKPLPFGLWARSSSISRPRDRANTGCCHPRPVRTPAQVRPAHPS